jgi:hypothetical protein
MARTRRVRRSASARVPKAIAFITVAVRSSLAYGSASEPVWAKKPANATGCAAMTSSARGPESAVTRWPATRRSIESSVK